MVTAAFSLRAGVPDASCSGLPRAAWDPAAALNETTLPPAPSRAADSTGNHCNGIANPVASLEEWRCSMYAWKAEHTTTTQKWRKQLVEQRYERCGCEFPHGERLTMQESTVPDS